MFSADQPTTLSHQLFIDGAFTDAATAGTFPVRNPATGATIVDVADGDATDARAAVCAAREAFPAWAARTAGERADLLQRWYELVVEHAEALARLLTHEQGKPLTEARGEVRYGSGFIRWFAAEARRAYGDVVPGHATDKRITVIKQPLGVVAAITPWNFPVAMITRKVAPALAAGCTVVLKPAEDTPLCALALASLAAEAGLPPGVFNVVATNQPAAVGEVLTTHPAVKKLSFTGSTEVGKLLMRQCAGTVKKLSLELGGNAPFIVFADADIDAAVDGAIRSKFRNAGQTCVCANRLFVQEAVYAEFVEKFTARVKELRVGNGAQEGSELGPLINAQALANVRSIVADARSKGASVATGSGADGDLFHAPVVLTEVGPDMRVATEEIFGPVAPIFKFNNESEVIALANGTPYGLAAYFYGRDQARCWRVAEALDFGMVGINTGMISTPVAPFGGVKESGFGREGGKYGLDEYLYPKYLCWSV